MLNSDINTKIAKVLFKNYIEDIDLNKVDNIKYERHDLCHNLSFYKNPLKIDRHKIHSYPAMLHPLLVDYLIKNFAKKNDIIFDPFNGSGVTLLQASLNEHEAIGFDINPLALLISKVKSTIYNIDFLLKDFEDFKKDLIENDKIDIPAIKNIDFWYKKETQRDLGRIRYILKNKNYNYKNFFIICFAFICRGQSLTRNGEFKRYRIEEKKIDKIENKVFKNLYLHITEMIKIINETENPKKNIHHFLKNSEIKIDDNINYDLIITSPPYGDSKTTVAYGQYSSFGMEWTDDLNEFGKIDYKIDNESLGKRNSINKNIYNSNILFNIIKKIEKIDKKRSDDVLFFFNGYYNVLKNVVNNLSRDGKVCFIVGNRRVKGIRIEMDQITADFLNQIGLKFEKILVRNISNKIMPLKNSPTNKIGETGETMTKEYIVIFSKK